MSAASFSPLHYAPPPPPMRGLDPVPPPTTTKTPAHRRPPAQCPSAHKSDLPSAPAQPSIPSGAACPLIWCALLQRACTLLRRHRDRAPPPPASSSIPNLSLNADAAPRRFLPTVPPLCFFTLNFSRFWLNFSLHPRRRDAPAPPPLAARSVSPSSPT
uniref:Uncharacterized protein n=1 Tax=Triticum urartu TaxID=4572 RepID=A0A8R7PD79_TRIUA